MRPSIVQMGLIPLAETSLISASVIASTLMAPELSWACSLAMSARSTPLAQAGKTAVNDTFSPMRWLYRY